VKGFSMMLVKKPGILPVEEFMRMIADGSVDPNGCIPVPVRTGKVGAGPARKLGTAEGSYALMPQSSLPHADTPDRYCVVRVSGDSLQPIYDDGAWALIDLGDRDPDTCHQRLVLVDVGRGCSVKYLVVRHDCYELRPINQARKPIVLPRSPDRNPMLGTVLCAWYDDQIQATTARGRAEQAPWRHRRRPAHKPPVPTPPPGYHTETMGDARYLVPDDQPAWLTEP